MARPAEFFAPVTLGDLIADVQWRRSTIRRIAEGAIEYMEQVQRATREVLSACRGMPEAELACEQIIGEIDARITFERAVFVDSNTEPVQCDPGRWRLSVGRSRPRGRRFRRTARSTRAGPQPSDPHLDEPHEHRRAP